MAVTWWKRNFLYSDGNVIKVVDDMNEVINGY